MADHLSTHDREGKKVTLSRKSWQQHVITNHPEMAGQEDAICRTIEDPDYVSKSPQMPRHPSGERLVACRREPTIRTTRPYVFVVIEYCPTGNWVPSTYLSPLPPKGEHVFLRLIRDR